MGVYLSLGSNVRDRRHYLDVALRELEQLPGTSVRAVSPVYATAPVGDEHQGEFLNMAAEIETALEPLEFLAAVKAIESRLGRQVRTRWGPREIDIDIILWDDRVMETEQLTIPHPEFRRRAFVLKPLLDIAAQCVDPVTGMTVAELAAQPEAAGTVHPAT